MRCWPRISAANQLVVAGCRRASLRHLVPRQPCSQHTAEQHGSKFTKRLKARRSAKPRELSRSEQACPSLLARTHPVVGVAHAGGPAGGVQDEHVARPFPRVSRLRVLAVPVAKHVLQAVHLERPGLAPGARLLHALRGVEAPVGQVERRAVVQDGSDGVLVGDVGLLLGEAGAREGGGGVYVVCTSHITSVVDKAGCRAAPLAPGCLHCFTKQTTCCLQSVRAHGIGAYFSSPERDRPTLGGSRLRAHTVS